MRVLLPFLTFEQRSYPLCALGVADNRALSDDLLLE